MLIKYSFPLANFFFMLTNTEKHEKLYLYKVFSQKQTEANLTNPSAVNR